MNDGRTVALVVGVLVLLGGATAALFGRAAPQRILGGEGS